MFTSTLLIICSLLQVGNKNVPSEPQERRSLPLPANVQTSQPLPEISPTVTPPQPIDSNLHFQAILLTVPVHHHIPISALDRSVLKSLRTEQRDADGNIMLDSEGNPIMVHITKGMNVFSGQVLGHFDDREHHANLKINQAQLEVAKAEMEKEIEVQYAATGVQMAIIELQTMEDVNRRVAKTVTALEILKGKYAWEQAVANLELQKYNLEVVKPKEFAAREAEMERTKVQIDQRKIIAPIDGMIVEIGAAEGKWLKEGDPVLEIMKLDTLWVQVLVDASRYTIADVNGKSATIRVIQANGRVETFQGGVVFCHPTITANNTFPAFIEIQNRRVGNYWLLQPGQCKADIVIPL